MVYELINETELKSSRRAGKVLREGMLELELGGGALRTSLDREAVWSIISDMNRREPSPEVSAVSRKWKSELTDSGILIWRVR